MLISKFVLCLCSPVNSNAIMIGYFRLTMLWAVLIQLESSVMQMLVNESYNQTGQNSFYQNHSHEHNRNLGTKKNTIKCGHLNAFFKPQSFFFLLMICYVLVIWFWQHLYFHLYLVYSKDWYLEVTFTLVPLNTDEVIILYIELEDFLRLYQCVVCLLLSCSLSLLKRKYSKLLPLINL